MSCFEKRKLFQEPWKTQQASIRDQWCSWWSPIYKESEVGSKKSLGLYLKGEHFIVHQDIMSHNWDPIFAHWLCLGHLRKMISNMISSNNVLLTSSWIGPKHKLARILSLSVKSHGARLEQKSKFQSNRSRSRFERRGHFPDLKSRHFCYI